MFATYAYIVIYNECDNGTPAPPPQASPVPPRGGHAGATFFAIRFGGMIQLSRVESTSSIPPTTALAAMWRGFRQSIDNHYDGTIMATYLDTAKYILERTGEISAMKLQKLMYYCQAWSLVWDEAALFEDDFEAWANGPVLPGLYNLHRGQFKIDAGIAKDGDSENITAEQQDSIQKVLEYYGDKTAQWLSNLTHQEAPWSEARGDAKPMDRSTNLITKASMHEYYSAL